MHDPADEEPPSSILFACTLNAVRSPMAAAIMRHLHGKFVHVESAGVRAGTLDPMAQEAMDEIGIAIGAHKPRRFEDIEDGSFDLIIALSPEAHHKAMELTRLSATRAEYWPTMDPTAVEGTRDQRLDAYRAVRDRLVARLRLRFARRPAADT